jgi:hypothetical protein
MASPEQYRREAKLVEEVAEVISLLPDKRALFTRAEFLRRLADEAEARLHFNGLGK